MLDVLITLLLSHINTKCKTFEPETPNYIIKLKINQHEQFQQLNGNKSLMTNVVCMEYTAETYWAVL